MRNLSDLPEIIKNLVIINGLMFIATYVLESAMGIDLVNLLGLHFFKDHDFQPYQIFTSMFMHGGIAHILFNMFSLISLGSILERVWGGKRFLFFYLFCGIGASFLHMAVQAYQVHHLIGSFDIYQALPEYTVQQLSSYMGILIGASGAIYGVMVAFAMLFPNTELIIMFIPYPIKAKYLIVIFILVDFFGGITDFSWDNIAHFAHLGGGLFGAILIWFWRKDRTNLY